MRDLHPEMLRWLDLKLALNGLAQKAIAEKDARLLFRLVLEACVGIQEATGRNDGRMVVLIQETIGNAVGEPWCMALIQTGLAYAEKKTGVISPIPASEHCQTVWMKTPKKQRVKTLPLSGAIAIWGDVGKASGHTEMVLSSDGKVFQAIGGNTSGTKKAGEKVNREGNGVFYTVRSHSSTAKRKLLGFLKPF